MQIGNLVTINPLAWNRYCEQNNIQNKNISQQRIITNINGDKVTLSFPLSSWKQSDIL